jgi:hypothetical protein
MKECNPVDQQARQQELDRLYELDGRADKSHKHHATYTGLYIAQQQAEVEQ